MSTPTLDMNNVKIVIAGRTLTNLQNYAFANEGEDAVQFSEPDLYGNQTTKIKPKKMRQLDVTVLTGSDDDIYLEDVYENKSKHGKEVSFSLSDGRRADKKRGGSGNSAYVTTPTTSGATDDNSTYRVAVKDYVVNNN